MLKYVRKKCVSPCGWGSCKDICEGCESKKCKIPVGARTRTREKGVFRFIYRPLLAVVGGCCHTSMEKDRLVDLKFISDVWQKTWEIFQKTWEIFRKTWEFFVGSSERRSRRSKVLQAQVRKRQSQCRAKGWNKRIVWSSRRKAVFLQGTRLRSLAE